MLLSNNKQHMHQQTIGRLSISHGTIYLGGLLEDVNECTTKELPPSPRSDGKRSRYHHRSKRFVSYCCWWTKSCTTKDDDYPIIYRVLTIPGGAGFCPSTVPLGQIDLNARSRKNEALPGSGFFRVVTQHLAGVMKSWSKHTIYAMLSNTTYWPSQAHCSLANKVAAMFPAPSEVRVYMRKATHLAWDWVHKCCYNVTAISTWISISIPSSLPYHHDHHYIDYIYRYVIPFQFNYTWMFNRWTVPLGSASGKHRYQGGGRWHSSARSLPPLQRNKSVPQKWMKMGH